MTIPTESGDILLLVTDGIEEALSPAGDLLRPDRVSNIIKQHSGDAAPIIVRTLLGVTSDFRAELQQGDDVTAIVVKF